MQAASQLKHLTPATTHGTRSNPRPHAPCFGAHARAHAADTLPARPAAGHVPGMVPGATYRNRGELSVLAGHRQYSRGIDSR